jgi:hypothetical protein
MTELVPILSELGIQSVQSLMHCKALANPEPALHFNKAFRNRTVQECLNLLPEVVQKLLFAYEALLERIVCGGNRRCRLLLLEGKCGLCVRRKWNPRWPWVLKICF